LVSAKKSWHSNYGNIAGKDLGASGGFGVFSLNAAYKPSKKITISTGVDNLFDKTYAEFVSRTGVNSSSAAVNPATFRVNEPGRTAWLKATIALD
jgi:iron complex outermembrane receptor protein